jgi:hypothetical protein
LRREALAHGYSVEEIERLCREGTWIRVRRGAYADASMWRVMSPQDRHRVIVHAVVRVLDRPAVVSHVSACVLLNLPTWGYDLSRVHVTRCDLHSPRIEGGVHHHAGSLSSDGSSRPTGSR